MADHQGEPDPPPKILQPIEGATAGKALPGEGLGKGCLLLRVKGEPIPCRREVVKEQGLPHRLDAFENLHLVASGHAEELLPARPGEKFRHQRFTDFDQRLGMGKRLPAVFQGCYIAEVQAFAKALFERGELRPVP